MEVTIVPFDFELQDYETLCNKIIILVYFKIIIHISWALVVGELNV